MSYSEERSLLIVSTLLFGVTAYWRLTGLSQENRDHETYSTTGRQRADVTEGSKVSSRCVRALAPATPYLEAFLKGLSRLCDPVHCPDGYIPFCMAENKLTIDVLAERLMNPGTATAAFSDSVVYCYNSFLGLPVARQAAAYFIAKRFYKTNHANLTPDEALSLICPENVGIGPGAAGLLNSLFYLLGEENDVCLIPAPYYGMFCVYGTAFLVSFDC
jgi:hypothetical protein